MQVHIEARQLGAVRAVLGQMRTHGVKPGPVTICQILKSCALAGTPVEAKAVAVRVWKHILVTQVCLRHVSVHASHACFRSSTWHTRLCPHFTRPSDGSRMLRVVASPCLQCTALTSKCAVLFL